jgi:predicted RNase H-like HicB family nuclease
MGQLVMKQRNKGDEEETVCYDLRQEDRMKINVIIHDAEEGGYWAEVPAIPGCATQGDTFEELLKNLYEAVEGCLSVDVEPPQKTPKSRVMEIAI